MMSLFATMDVLISSEKRIINNDFLSMRKTFCQTHISNETFCPTHAKENNKITSFITSDFLYLSLYKHIKT